MFWEVLRSEVATFVTAPAMRHPFEAQPDLQIVPIEKIRLPLRSRDELPPIFHAMLDKHLALVERRLLQEETLPAHEKVLSHFEPHAEWIQKGKRFMETTSRERSATSSPPPRPSARPKAVRQRDNQNPSCSVRSMISSCNALERSQK